MKKFLMLFVLLMIWVFSVSVPAFAHEERTVGAYDLELGWRVEPAYVGVYNGPEFFVHDADSDDPVTGLEDTLQLQVSFGGQEKMLEFYQVEDDPGHYTADLIPTRPGDYAFTLSGKIGDQDVNETFTSADGYFGSVDPASDVMFPTLDSSDDIASLQVQIDQLKAQIETLTGTETP